MPLFVKVPVNVSNTGTAVLRPGRATGRYQPRRRRPAPPAVVAWPIPAGRALPRSLPIHGECERERPAGRGRVA